MRQSKLFTKTRREAPKDEVAKNAQLLIRGGFVHKEMAGVYDLLPLGLRVMERIENIIRQEMNAIGGQEIHMSALQDRSVWEKSGRWDDSILDVWFKTKLKSDTELGLATTHEEPISSMLTNHTSSYKDLPFLVYQFQTKFRNELRSKSGILRGREFLMKDMYSFASSEEEHQKIYEQLQKTYMSIFSRVGMCTETYLTYASGGSFSKYSHEFQALSDAGEDTIYVCTKCGIAVNDEIIDTQNVCPKCGNNDLKEHRSIEIGNIFPLGTKYSKAFGLVYRDERGEEKPVVMGSYGIGLGRLMGTVVEVCSDEKGIVWPKSIAPFSIHLLVIAQEEGGGVRTEAEKLYTYLTDNNINVLYDDRTVSPGEKLADADLIGIPLRVVVSKKTIEKGKIEIQNRAGGEAQLCSQAELMERTSELD